MEGEIRKVEVKENRFFLAKYWMYIGLVVLFVAIDGVEGGEYLKVKVGSIMSPLDQINQKIQFRLMCSRYRYKRR